MVTSILSFFVHCIKFMIGWEAKKLPLVLVFSLFFSYSVSSKIVRGVSCIKVSINHLLLVNSHWTSIRSICSFLRNCDWWQKSKTAFSTIFSKLKHFSLQISTLNSSYLGVFWQRFSVWSHLVKFFFSFVPHMGNWWAESSKSRCREI